MVRVLEIAGLERNRAQHGGLGRWVADLIRVEGIENGTQRLACRLAFFGVGRARTGVGGRGDALETGGREGVARGEVVVCGVGGGGGEEERQRWGEDCDEHDVDAGDY